MSSPEPAPALREPCGGREGQGPEPGAEPAPSPDRRGAPWPLILHLASAATRIEQGARLAPVAAAPDFPWRGALRPEDRRLAEAVAGAPELPIAVAIRAEGARRLSLMLAGLRRYQQSRERRSLADPPPIWRSGAARLRDFGGAPGARTVFVAPSLINRYHILDLDEGASLIRHLAGSGLRPLLLDWGEPGEAERGFSLDDYVERRLLPAFDAARKAAGGPISVVGYCLGGTLAAALPLLRAGDVRRLALIGAPWDFSKMTPMQGALASLGVSGDRESLSALVDTLGATYGAAPVPFMQAVFAQLDPGLADRKFRRFAELPEGAPEVRRFVLLEDWLNDGPPLAAPAAREALIDWHLENQTMAGRWRLSGRTVRLGEIAVPTLVAAARRDRITPSSAAAAFARSIPDARLITPDAGHVGMITGRDAMAQLWRPLADFLLA